MPLDSTLQQLVQDGAGEGHIRENLRRRGWRSLRDKALDVIDRGESTLEEVLRVTRSEQLDEKTLAAAAGSHEEERGHRGRSADAQTRETTADVS
jgi:hypothetical protein